MYCNSFVLCSCRSFYVFICESGWVNGNGVCRQLSYKLCGLCLLLHFFLLLFFLLGGGGGGVYFFI